MKSFFSVLTGLLTLFLFSSATLKDRGVYIYQNNVSYALTKETQKVKIDRNSFSFCYYNKVSMGAQISISTNKDFLKTLEVGMNIDSTTCFAKGTGLAANINNGYEYLEFNENAHHYLYYEDEDDRRVNLLNSKSEFLRLEFNVTQFMINGQLALVRKTALEEVFIAILIDKNSNNIIDEGELNKVILTLE